MKKVYLAGPYSLGNQFLNVRSMILAADEVLSLGFSPFVPLLSCLWEFLSPRPYEDWLKMDLDWLAACDYVLRLPGESPGADREVALAQELGIPVFYGLEAFAQAMGPALMMA